VAVDIAVILDCLAPLAMTKIELLRVSLAQELRDEETHPIHPGETLSWTIPFLPFLI
jgi:hypothetical protein